MSSRLPADSAGAVPAGAAPSTLLPTTSRESEFDLLIAGREAVATDVVAITLADPGGAALPAWTPGAHIDVVLDSCLVRQYSLCGRSRDPATWRIGVLRTPDSRGGSQRLHDRFAAGGTVRVRGPRNHFRLVDAPRYVFVAGGIGITPLLPMIEAVERRGVPWTLTYGGRERGSMAFLDELAAYGDRVTLWPQDERGLLDLPAILGEPREDTLVYCCGPEGLLSAVESACAGWPPGALHVERFAPRAAAPAQDRAVELVLQRSGITTIVPADVSILDAVEKAGVSVLSSCRQGTCGTCEQWILDGEPDHRDSVLSADERAAGESMMICVSRARSERLVLDL